MSATPGNLDVTVAMAASMRMSNSMLDSGAVGQVFDLGAVRRVDQHAPRSERPGLCICFLLHFLSTRGL